jgi:hypothetical protein
MYTIVRHLAKVMIGDWHPQHHQRSDISRDILLIQKTSAFIFEVYRHHAVLVRVGNSKHADPEFYANNIEYA